MPRLNNLQTRAVMRLPHTQLDPLEEALFQAWAGANQIEKPDKGEFPVDYRGVYKELGGKVQPYGAVNNAVQKSIGQQTIMNMLQSRDVG